MQPVEEVTAHVVLYPELSVTQIKPLQLYQIHPDLLTNTAFTEFLMQNLISRSATRQGIKALVLSAPYLPAQLFTMQDLAAKQSVGVSLFLSSDSSTLHTAFYRQQPSALADDQQDEPQDPPELDVSGLEQALGRALGPIQPLPYSRLQVAETAEQSLKRQLRLWDPATWSSVLQQQLESRHSCTSYLAIRSLMGPPALQAAQKLVEKKGLYWLELPANVISNSGVTSGSDSTAGGGGSTAGRRRRKDSRGSSTAATMEVCVEPGVEQSGGGDKVIIVSRIDLAEADENHRVQFLLQCGQAFTDYRADYRVGGSTQESAFSSSIKQQTEEQTGNPLTALFRKFQGM
jgi:hypothetical protein